MSYTVLNVGAFSADGAMPVVNGLNSKGAVIGTSPITPTGQYVRGFVYRHGKLNSVGTMGGNSQADGINDQGTIVGLTLLFPNNSTRAQPAVFIRRHGRISELTPLAPNSVFDKISINNRNEVTGFPAPNGDDLLLRNGKLIDIGSINHLGSVANYLSNSGEIVGSSVTSGLGTADLAYHAFSYVHRRMTDLGTLGGAWSEAQGVNNSGAIVGSSLLAGDVVEHPFLYENGKMIDLPTLGGQNGIAHAINDRGVIVGSADIPDGALHAFIYQNGVMTDLNSLIPAKTGYVLYRGIAINNKGQIVVQAYAANDPVIDNNPIGPFSVFRLNPVKG